MSLQTCRFATDIAMQCRSLNTTAEQREALPELQESIRRIEADLVEQGVWLFPYSESGRRAYRLWHQIKQHLFRGGAVHITTSVLGLSWHREELKRARNVLIEMQLIKRRPDGLYVLGKYDWLDEELRERFSELRVVEEVMITLSGLMNKVKTQMLPSV
jgi:hypothetical protein